MTDTLVFDTPVLPFEVPNLPVTQGAPEKPRRRGRKSRLVIGLISVSTLVGTGILSHQLQTAAGPLDKFYNQTIQWGSCKGFEMGGPELNHGLQCARVTVPLDYSKPDGETASIAISRSRATGNKIGSILVNPGGPGGSGLSMPTDAGYSSTLGENFDVIGFDPRGIGASTPAIKCTTTSEMDQSRQSDGYDNTPAGITAQEASTKAWVSSCVKRSGLNLLAHVGTRDVVRDMDIIRAVLGDDKLTYVGYSYGTRLGATYAEMFPDNVRAMVLDGALDPTQNRSDQLVKQNRAFQQAFDDYAAYCARFATCPLGNDPTKAVSNYRVLIESLIGNPAETKDGRGLSYGDAQTAVSLAMYSPALWGYLTQGLSEVTQGTGDTLLMLADASYGRRADGTYTNELDARIAVRCVDDPAATDRDALGKLDTAIREAAPFEDDGRGTGLAPLDTCAFWPVPTTSKPHAINIPALPKIVVVSTTHDPATPYQAGVDLARQLRASLLTYQGTQHGAFLNSGKCIDDAVIAYLRDLKDPGNLTCAPDTKS
ncbi:alpha/beta hydrolase [Smaragdicoccus niigatensis]|uniref:alpha/beta hydrolase n=1 Tax=Smaragdicoccus niigatensis TaxID=359359 RepID=UPI00036C439C|nr:alpha/beta hydrolase [Smaragdicoccus niigatensis]